MTTLIVQHNTDGFTFAADQRAMHGGAPLSVCKLYALQVGQRDCVYVMGSGTLAGCQAFLDALVAELEELDGMPTYSFQVDRLLRRADVLAYESAPEFDRPFGSDVFVVAWPGDAVPREVSGGSVVPVVPVLGTRAWGSGGDFALGALDAGGNLPQAFAITSRRDLFTSPGYDYVVVPHDGYPAASNGVRYIQIHFNKEAT